MHPRNAKSRVDRVGRHIQAVLGRQRWESDEWYIRARVLRIDSSAACTLSHCPCVCLCLGCSLSVRLRVLPVQSSIISTVSVSVSVSKPQPPPETEVAFESRSVSVRFSVLVSLPLLPSPLALSSSRALSIFFSHFFLSCVLFFLPMTGNLRNNSIRCRRSLPQTPTSPPPLTPLRKEPAR